MCTRHARPRSGQQQALAGLLLASLLLTACATPPQPRPSEQAGAARLPPRVELSQVAFFPQEDYQCGPAALATVLTAQGVAVAPEELETRVYLPGRRGSLQAEMTATARSYGLLAYPLAPELTALLVEVASGNPVLVLQNLGLSWVPRWHYAVVVGYDLAREELVLRSGQQRRRITQFAVFERTWARSRHWALVLTNPAGIPATAQPLPFLRAAQDLEAGGHTVAARDAYRAAGQRWADNAVAAVGLGNTEYALRHYRLAEAAFREALRRDPTLAEAWNNLAYALAGRGCLKQARQAADCAVQTAPDDPAYRASVAELKQTQSTSDGGRCAPISCPRSR